MAKETSIKQPPKAEPAGRQTPPPVPGAAPPPVPPLPPLPSSAAPPPIPQRPAQTGSVPAAAFAPPRSSLAEVALPPAPPPGKPSLTSSAASSQPMIASPPLDRQKIAATAAQPHVAPVNDESAEIDEPGQSPRRAAKRRPAGPSRPAIAANDDLPSIGGLIFALHQKPSRRPLTIAAIASLAWALIGGGLAFALLLPELKGATGLAGLLAKPTAIIVAAAIIIPIALFWLLALVAWRAQELKLMSSAMTEVAIRLAEPDRMAEQQIASVGQAVRRQVSHMNDAVSRALGRASELEALVHNEVASLERSYMQNEHRIRGLLQELSGERIALVNTSDKVNVSLKELGTEIPTLIDRLGDQQVKLARFIEDAGRNLVALESSLAHNAGNLATSVGQRTEELRGLLTDQTQQIQTVMGENAQRIEGSLSHHVQHIESTLGERTAALEATLSGHAETVAGAIVRHTDNMQGVFDNFSDGLNDALGERTEGLQTVLEEYTRALDQTLAGRQQQLDAQLIARTKALDDAFSERLALFDESVLRSTIAIDSSVADKARALSTALESHAKEIGHVLGRQAGELDEQIMHGVHAVRRASENVTRQSLKAIEGLAGQADLLKNVSENLVNQIGSVTGRFDQQGQTIMRAANALETANFRIDKTLQNRQLELSETLDKLSGKAEDIDRVLKGYSTSLEGTFQEAETRARNVGETLTRGTEERSRVAFHEIERLQAQSTAESDRALADLRGRFTTVSREVGDEIGSLSQRVTDSSEEMRRQAQRTLSELETEHLRLKAQMERLPEATRATAESMRTSLQDQLKALEQLSQLSAREATRADISPPMSQPFAQPAMPRGFEPPAPQPRAISSVTQRLANELAATRGRSPDSVAPAALQPLPQPVPVPAPPRGAIPAARQGTGSPNAGSRDGWSLGDLLARASEDEEASRPASAGAGTGSAINIANIARALDPTTASAIWSRFRAGQRGVMVRSIYSVEGRAAFDELQSRYKADPAFRESVDRYMLDFEQLLRDGDQRDASGRTAQSYVTSESGRVYLFLVHASGRLA